MVMAASMAAMMAPTAAPFFLAYGRDSRRPAGIAAVVLMYVGVWAAIGLALNALMSQVMLPSSALIVGGAAAFAVVYTLMPWSRHARERCREMCRREPRASALREGATYATSCVVCSAGVMAVLIVLGMTNLIVLVAGAAVMLAYKLI